MPDNVFLILTGFWKICQFNMAPTTQINSIDFQ
jgi:hypothetical protein